MELSEQGQAAPQEPSTAVKYRRLRLILGDQLNAGHSWFQAQDSATLYLIAELEQETHYVRHHVQKICAFFAAIERFALALRGAGHDVLHLNLDDTARFEDLPTLLDAVITRWGITCVEYQRPDEYRLHQQLKSWSERSAAAVMACDSEHFILQRDEINRFFRPGTRHRMEAFYRKMRQRCDVLMTPEGPEGGHWNYDSENRRPLKRKDLLNIPAPLAFNNDVSDILQRLERHSVPTLGTPMTHLPWPVDRQQALRLLEHFCLHCLPDFGRFQDAMTCLSPHAWSLYHSRLSFALNCKLLHPLEVVETALSSYRNSTSGVGLAQIEGFIRQIIGWREFVRGIYWSNMPQYTGLNALNAANPLPAWYWSGDTDMNCLRQSVSQSLERAYAHHIQRLMITGNFALLAALAPDEVENWYLGIYVDALEWVESPNTRGMALFADGGLIASKPYAASGNYISRMSDYCTDCRYAVKSRTGPDACPFNALYWHFLARNQESLGANPRLAFAYRNLRTMDVAARREVMARGDQLLGKLDAI